MTSSPGRPGSASSPRAGRSRVGQAAVRVACTPTSAAAGGHQRQHVVAAAGRAASARRVDAGRAGSPARVRAATTQTVRAGDDDAVAAGRSVRRASARSVTAATRPAGAAPAPRRRGRRRRRWRGSGSRPGRGSGPGRPRRRAPDVVRQPPRLVAEDPGRRRRRAAGVGQRRRGRASPRAVGGEHAQPAPRAARRRPARRAPPTTTGRWNRLPARGPDALGVVEVDAEASVRTTASAPAASAHAARCRRCPGRATCASTATSRGAPRSAVVERRCRGSGRPDEALRGDGLGDSDAGPRRAARCTGTPRGARPRRRRSACRSAASRVDEQLAARRTRGASASRTACGPSARKRAARRSRSRAPQQPTGRRDPLVLRGQRPGGRCVMRRARPRRPSLRRPAR